MMTDLNTSLDIGRARKRRPKMKGPGDKYFRPVEKLVSIDPINTYLIDDLVNWQKNNDNYIVKIALPDMDQLKIIPKMTEDKLFVRYSNNKRENIFSSTILKKLSLSEGKDSKAILLTLIFSPQMKLREKKIEKVWAQNSVQLSFSYLTNAVSDETMKYHQFAEDGLIIAKKLFRKRLGAEGPIADSGNGYMLDAYDNLRVSNPPLNPFLFVIQELMTWANLTLTEYCQQQGLALIYKNRKEEGLPSNAAECEIALAEYIEYAYSLIPSRCGVPLATFSSPLRRYVDTVHLKILTAAMAGKEQPFAADYLKGLTAKLNQKEIEYKRSCLSNEKSRLAKYYGWINGRLDSKKFFHLLGVEPQADIIRLIKLGVAGVNDLLVCIFRNRVSKKIRQAAKKFLANNPGMIYAFLAEGHEQGIWHLEEKNVFKGATTVYYTLRISRDKGRPQFSSCKGRTIKQARERAAALLLKRIL